MGSPFLYSCDLWIADTRRRPDGRGTQRPLFYIAESWSAARRHPYRVDYLLESAPARRPRVVSIPIHFLGSDASAEHTVPDAISLNEISAVAEKLAEENKGPISEDVERKTVEDEGFVMVAAEEAASYSPTDTESKSDSASESRDRETTEEATEDSMVAAGMEQVLKKVMTASERLQGWWR